MKSTVSVNKKKSPLSEMSEGMLFIKRGNKRSEVTIILKFGIIKEMSIKKETFLTDDNKRKAGKWRKIMKQIVVQSVKEGNRYLRRINKSGKVAANVKCSQLATLAQDIMIQKLAWEGNMIMPDVLDSVSGAVFLQKILIEKAQKDFFIPLKSINYETSLRVWYMLLQLRMGQVTEEYQSSPEHKVEQIKEVIAAYENFLKQENKYDICRIYREAISVLESEERKNLMFADEYVISELCLQKLTFLEKKFWKLLTGEKYEIAVLQTEEGKNLEESLEKEELPKLLKGAEFFRGYGISNEIYYVIQKIREQKQAYGEVVILYSSVEYEPFLEAIFGSAKIPYSMTGRQSAADNRYVGLMKLVLRWAESDFSYQELKPVVRAFGVYGLVKPFYKAIGENIGWGLNRYKAYIRRVKEDVPIYEKEKDYIDFLEKLVAVFDVAEANAVSYAKLYQRLLTFVREVLGNHPDYAEVKNPLYQEIQILKQMDKGDMKDVISMLQKRLQSLHWNQPEENNAVNIVKMSDKVRILDRKYIYLLGMSAAHFGSSSTGSSLLSDKELISYLDRTKGFVRIAEEKEQLLINGLYGTLATRGKDSSLSIGYCSYDTVHLRPQAPSVTYLRMLHMCGVEKKNVILAEYSNLLEEPIHFEEQDIWQPGEVCEVLSDSDKEETKKIIPMSVTSLQTLLGCPLQYFYQKICYLPQEDYKEPLTDKWLSAAEKGTLTHAILEQYINQWFVGKDRSKIPTKFKEESFNNIEKQVVNSMIRECPFVSYTTHYLERIEIKEKCRDYLIGLHKEFSDPNNRWQMEACEEKYSDLELYYNEKGSCDTAEEAKLILQFSGSLDRVDVRVDEQGQKHYRIIDYKTGGRAKLMDKEKNGKLIQHIIYAMAILKRAERNREQVVVDEVCYHTLFEEEKENQCFSSKDMGNKDLTKLEDKVHKLIVETLIKKEFCSLENMTINKESEKEKILKKTDCSYCTYKDICKEQIGETL